MADGDGLTGQFVDESRKIYSVRQHHGDIVLQHVTETLCCAEEDSACACVWVVLVQLTEKGTEQCYLLTSLKWYTYYSYVGLNPLRLVHVNKSTRHCTCESTCSVS